MSEKYLYQWEELSSVKRADKAIDSWDSAFGPIVVERDKSGAATKVRFSVLVDNPKVSVFIVGDFNKWGKSPLENYRLIPDEHAVLYSIELPFKHGEAYKFLVEKSGNKRFMQDPAGSYFDDAGNTIFWDYEGPDRYHLKHNFIDTRKRSTKILQTDLPGLVMHWADEDGTCGREMKENKLYRFIAESGVLSHIKKLGFNTIQFLPFAQSIDGTNWKFRYLVPFQYAIQKNWGTPDEFAQMIDACHTEGIAVIGDFVIGHLPFKDFRIFGQDGENNGIHNWVNRHGLKLYMKEVTSWGTMRIDYDNPYVRAFIIESCLHFMKRYRIDGLRIDNVDGIIRYGINGEGTERPSGRLFLRQLNQEIYSYNPRALIHFESHYYHGDNAKLLVIPFTQDQRALGAIAYNSSRMTYYFHTEYMPKSVDEVTPWKFKHIAEEKEWGQSNSTIADFHNHDAAAGLMPMRATGSYAYDAMTHDRPENHSHAVGKIKVMEAIISFCCEGRTLDLMQTFLLQEGTFEHDSSIMWHLAFNQCNNNMVEYKRSINLLLDNPAFYPDFVAGRKFLNIDDKNKVLVVERSTGLGKPGERFICIMNLSSFHHHDYKVGLTSTKNFKVVLNSDKYEYAGTGRVSYPQILENRPSKSFEVLDREVVLRDVAPYGVIVLKEII